MTVYNCEQICLRFKEEAVKYRAENCELDATVCSNDWMRTLLTDYKDNYNIFTDVDDVYKVVIPLYRVLYYTIGDGKPITMGAFIDEHLKRSMFFNGKTWNEREVAMMSDWLFNSFIECVIGWGEY